MLTPKASKLGIIASILFCGLFLSAWAFWLEPAGLSNESYEIVVPSWPAFCDGIRVAVLADLHIGSPYPYNDVDKLRRVVDVTSAAQPDLILLAGDYVIHGVLGGKFVEPEIESFKRAPGRLRSAR